MDRKKHKRLNDTIMKPEDLKKSRIQKPGGLVGPSTSSGSVPGGIKAKLDFRSTAAAPISRPNVHINTTAAGPQVQSSHTVRPVVDDRWKEFGDTINLTIDTFAKSIKESVELDKFNKVARMIVAALKSFIVEDKVKIEYRLLGTISETIKNHGQKLNHVHLHRGLLYFISTSRSYPDNLVQVFVALATSLAKQQPMLDKCYISAYLHDAIGMNSGLGTANRCAWIDKPYAQDLVNMILSPFATVFPIPEMYTACQIEGFTIADYFPKEKLSEQENSEQLSVFLEFLKPWFDNIRGEVIPKPLFRALCILCGYDQVRFFIASRLEVWITLQKFHREISELLLVLGCNIDATKALDKEIIDILLKLNTKNMKTRTVSGPFTVAIRRVCEQPANVNAVIESLFLNEIGLPQNRSPANLPTMFMLLANQPVEATRALAVVCAKDMIREKDNSTKLLRSFLRELIRGFCHTRSGDFPFSVFASTLLHTVLKRGEADEVPILAAELICQIPLATLSSLLVTRENAFSSKYNIPSAAGDFPLIPPEARVARDKFQSEFVLYCEAVLEWLQSARRVISDEASYIRCYSLLLYLEKQREVYTNMDSSAVSDQEIGNCLRIFGECGISEKMLLLLFGEEKTNLPSKILMEFTSALTQRAAVNHSKFLGTPLVKLSDPFKLIEQFLSTSILPENELPRFEGMPSLCSKNLYWTAWSVILLWIAGGEIVPYFEKIYNGFPILRYLIYCIMTKQYDFPLDFEGKSSEMMKEDEEANCAAESLVIAQYEKRMKRPPNSLTVNILMFPQRKDFRAPQFFEDIRVCAEKFKLASRFASCTSPPLLSRLIDNIGAENSLHAIREMLTADSSTASMLTAECVFHALMYYFDNQRYRDVEQSSNLVIRALVRQAELNFKSIEPIENDFLLNSFISSLASPNISIRSAVVNTFAKIFPSSEERAFDLVKLSKVPRFGSEKLKYMETLASAILVESDTHLANAYLHFLAQSSYEENEIHTLARAVCHTLSVDSTNLHASLCEYFLQYVELCIQKNTVVDATSLDESLCCVEFVSSRVAVSREVPVAVIKLLSKYVTIPEDEGRDTAFEELVKQWLTPGSIPKLVDGSSGVAGQFLSLPMRKEMLKSSEQRVVDAALDELSETDAQEFVLVSQMSKETAEKVIRKAEDMKLDAIDEPSLINMLILLRGYRMKGIQSGAALMNRLKEEIERRDVPKLKDEPMEVTEISDSEFHKPMSFVEEGCATGTFTNLEISKFPTTEISAWLKTNCSIANAKQKDTPTLFRLPSAFIQSAMNEERSALACLQHIEANLKFFLSHESAFQTLIVIVDAAANKFSFVQNRLENLAVRLLKSVTPPASVFGVLQKHATNSRSAIQLTTKAVRSIATTFAQFSLAIKGVSGEREKRIVDEFMRAFVQDKGEVIEWNDVLLFIRSLRSVYSGGNPESTAERCLSNQWSPDLQRAVCCALLEKYHETVCSVFVFRIVSAYCKKYPIASYSELFMTRNSSNQFVVNKKSFNVLSIYFAEVATRNEDYDLRIINLISGIEKQGGSQSGYQFGSSLIQTSCAHPKAPIRKTAKRLLEAVSERLSYLHYKTGVASSIRLLTNIESRESCIRRCEQIVDRLVEMPMDPKLALAEDICEEDRPVKEQKEDENKYSTGSKRPYRIDRERDRRGGPPAKKGRFITAKDLPIPLIGGSLPPEEVVPPDEPQKREWIATSQAMTRFVSLLREHPTIVKMKFPVLANYVSRLCSMTRRELKEENRLRKIELILHAVVVLCPFLLPEEMSSVETAIGNCLEFYEKHLEDGSFGIREQSAFAELTIRACVAFLNSSFNEARTFLRENRQMVERVCKRSCDPYNVEMVLDNCGPSLT